MMWWEENTHIAEIRNRLNMTVPEGFAITTRAFRAFFDHPNSFEIGWSRP